jgi:CHAT domain-containing protein/tetratricopeptide (TPR) repeat protein
MRDPSLEIDLRGQMQQASEAGWAALEARRWETAEAAYFLAVSNARELEDVLAEALFLSYLAMAKRELGHIEEARHDLDLSITLAQEFAALPIEAHARYLLAELELDEGKDEAAVDQLLRSLGSALECGELSTAEVASGKLGLIYLNYGWMEPAGECFRQALEIIPESPNRFAWLGNLGNTLTELGQFEQALKSYHEAYEIARQKNDPGAESKCLASEALVHFQEARYEQSVRLYQQALEVAHGLDAIVEGIWLGNLGNVYLQLGDPDKATELTQRGLLLARENKDQRAEAAHLDTWGDCLIQQGQIENALDKYKQALTIGRSINDKLGERIYLANVGRAFAKLGKYDEGYDYLDAAISLFELQRGRIKVSESFKTSFASNAQPIYRDMIRLCLTAGKRVEALEYVGRAKSRAILDLLNNSPIDISELEGTEDDTVTKLIEREKQLSAQIARLERIYWQGMGDESSSSQPGGTSGHRGLTIAPEDAPRLYNEWREVVDQLKLRHPSYASMVSASTLAFKEVKALWKETEGVQQCLSENTAIMEFFWTGEFMLSAAIWKDCGDPVTNIIMDEKELGKLTADVADFLEMSATEGWEVPTSICKRLYQRLVAPLVAALPAQVIKLIMVPHGNLHKVPFAALHDGQGYFIEKYSLSYLPTISLIPILMQASHDEQMSEASRYLISAISDYSATRDNGIVFSSRLRSAAGLEDLSYTLEEAKTVFSLASQYAKGAKLITNQEVKDGLLSDFDKYPVVHFAGHAVFNPEEPLASGLVLADGSILTAARILQGKVLRTHCGKLLVLSACQTGVNVITDGGEILGLARALMYAGMPNLILSLWEVADRSTADLMQDFHQLWQAGKNSIPQALQQAQMKAAQAGQPIHAWAPFVHLGID